jgi:uncharacterized protein
VSPRPIRRRRPPPLALGSLGLSLLLALTGCLGLSYGAPPQQHFILDAGTVESEARAAGMEPLPRPLTAASAPFTVGLRPIRMSAYLATPHIVVRQGEHQIEFSEAHRWGEALGQGIQQVLAAEFRHRAPAQRLVLAPWPMGEPPLYLIQLHLLRFEGVRPEDPLAPLGSAHLQVTWEILIAQTGTLALSGTTEVANPEWRVGDFAGLVGLLRTSLATLAQDLLEGLGQIPPPVAPSASSP